MTHKTFKQLTSGDDNARKMLAGVLKLSKVVGSTLGPRGLNVTIDRGPWQPPLVTNDGVTVAASITLEDEVENLAAQLVKSAAQSTNDFAGDGTTTATVLAARLYQEGLKRIQTGCNPILLKKALDFLVTFARGELSKLALPVASAKDIKNIARVSSGSEAVGQVLADLYEAAGPDGMTTLEPGLEHGVCGEFREGLTWASGLWAPQFVNNPTKAESAWEDIPVLLLDLPNVSDPTALVPLMKAMVSAGQPRLLVVAKAFSGGALATAVFNCLKADGFKTCAVKATGDSAWFSDVAALTGATVINDACGLKLDALTPEHLGKVRRVVSDMTCTTLVALADADTKARVAARVAQIESDINDAKNDSAVEALLARKSKLTTGVSVVKVGASSEIEAAELRLRVEDAINACRAASREGVVAGGGRALLQVAAAFRFKDPATLGMKTLEERAAYEILCRVLEEPARVIANNAGSNPDSVVERLYSEYENPHVGFNALTCVFEDLVAAGVVDPALVTRSALENAVSVVGTLLTTDYSVVSVDNSPVKTN